MSDAKKQPLTAAEKRERAKARRAERKAQRRATEDAWKAQVAAHFGYLETTYGFHGAAADASSVWETYVRYESSLLAITVTRSVEFDRVEVWLIRLVDGCVPEYPIFINPDTPINYVILDKVLMERAPQEAVRLRDLKGLSAEQVEASLVFLAQALRTYCDDALRGDFAIFDVVAARMHQQAREHPQEIRVVLPETATAAEERELVERVRKANPQQPVTVSRYSTQVRVKRGKRQQATDAQGPEPTDQQRPGPL
ncbi:MAG TPA: hypothetical protein VFU88_15575 [Ktedonobacterales bacterium]|nr:hypothetical protein [Ktedonobacterales bacterium]